MSTESYRQAEARLWAEFTGKVPNEHFLRLPSLSTQVRVLEYGEGPPLLFVHGGPNAASTWAPLVAHISGYKCLMLDRPGCGLSDAMKTAPKRVREHVSGVVGGVLDINEPAPVGLVGSSFGSYSLLSYSVGHPDETRPAVHFGCPALVPGCKVPLRFVLQSLPGFRSLLIKLEPPTIDTATKSFRGIGHEKSIDDGKIPKVVFEWYAALLAHTRTRENELALYGRIRPKDNLKMDELGILRQPMSFFWGTDDTFGGVAVAEAIADTISSAELELVDDAGHLPWIDAPEAAAKHLEGFFARTLNE